MFVKEEVFCTDVDKYLDISLIEDVFIVRDNRPIGVLSSSIEKEVLDEI